MPKRLFRKRTRQKGFRTKSQAKTQVNSWKKSGKYKKSFLRDNRSDKANRGLNWVAVPRK